MRSTKHTPLEELFLTGEKLTFKKHQTIFTSEEAQLYTYYIQKGHVAVYSAQIPKNTRLLSILKPKDFFPILVSVIRDNKSARFIALDEVKLYALPVKKFEQATQDPQYAPNILTATANMLSICVDRLDNLEMSKANARLMARIIFFADKYGTIRGKNIFINIPMTHAIIASSIAATRETVTREIIKLEKKGLIQYKNQKITIFDLKKLQAELAQVLS